MKRAEQEGEPLPFKTLPGATAVSLFSSLQHNSDDTRWCDTCWRVALDPQRVSAKIVTPYPAGVSALNFFQVGDGAFLFRGCGIRLRGHVVVNPGANATQPPSAGPFGDFGNDPTIIRFANSPTFRLIVGLWRRADNVDATQLETDIRNALLAYAPFPTGPIDVSFQDSSYLTCAGGADSSLFSKVTILKDELHCLPMEDTYSISETKVIPPGVAIPVFNGTGVVAGSVVVNLETRTRQHSILRDKVFDWHIELDETSVSVLKRDAFSGVVKTWSVTPFVAVVSNNFDQFLPTIGPSSTLYALDLCARIYFKDVVDSANV